MDDQYYHFLHRDELNLLPLPLQKAYETLQKDCMENSAASAGNTIRTVIGSICKAINIRTRNLRQKIQGLYKKGYIAPAAVAMLQTFFGKRPKSAGKATMLSSDHVRFCVEVINFILRMMIYLRPSKQ